MTTAWKLVAKKASIFGMEINGFEKLNRQREESGEKLFANPRNSTAGTLKLQDPRIVASRPLDVFVYFLSSQNFEFETQNENLELLKKLGLKVNPNYKLCKDINEVIEFCRYWGEQRENLPYEIDGVVVIVTSIMQQKILGNIHVGIHNNLYLAFLLLK